MIKLHLESLEEFHAVWEALQEFVDNSEEVLNEIAERINNGEGPTQTEISMLGKIEAARGLVERIDGFHVTATLGPNALVN